MSNLMKLRLFSSLFKRAATAYEGGTSCSQSPIFQMNRSYVTFVLGPVSP